MSITMKQLEKRQRGRTPMAKENRRTMQIRFSVEEQAMVLDGLEHVRKIKKQTDEDLRTIDILIERTAALK